MRGAAFRELLIWHARKFGQAELDRVAEHAGLADQLTTGSPSLGVLASRWYRAELVHALLDSMARDWSLEQRRIFALEASDEVMRATLRGVYRLLFRMMATPERYAKHSPKLWRAYYDSGDFSVDQPEAGRAICRITEWNAHHPFACELNWGAAGAIYRAMGCRDVHVEREACVAGSERECRFVTTWSVSDFA